MVCPMDFVNGLSYGFYQMVCPMAFVNGLSYGFC
jgi:hypothetical protein